MAHRRLTLSVVRRVKAMIRHRCDDFDAPAGRLRLGSRAMAGASLY